MSTARTTAPCALSWTCEEALTMWEIVKAVILGVIEGITEWLPVSSTGHLILADEFLSLNMSEEFIEMFNVVIQLGAILAVVVLFWPKLWPFQNDPEAARGETGAKALVDRFCRKDVWVM